MRVCLENFSTNFEHSEDKNVQRGTAAVLHEVKILIRNEGFQSLSKGRSLSLAFNTHLDTSDTSC